MIRSLIFHICLNILMMFVIYKFHWDRRSLTLLNFSLFLPHSVDGLYPFLKFSEGDMIEIVRKEDNRIGLSSFLYHFQFVSI